MDYRNSARQYLKSANTELSNNATERLKFAALELRMAMEALTYDRALAYKDEFPPNEYETWQPRKLMSILLEFDPTADMDSTIAIGEESDFGVPARALSSLGTEKIFNIKALNKHYDALGSYLHVQSMKQVRLGVMVNHVAFRARLEAIATFIEDVLNSPVFNVTFGSFSSQKCLECGSLVRKRIPTCGDIAVAKCHECNAEYKLHRKSDGEIEWEPDEEELNCANTSCDNKTLIWRHQLKVGARWNCSSCHGQNTVVKGIRYDARQSKEPK